MEQETEFTFRNSQLPECCFKVLADIRRKNRFCDVEVSIGKHRISAHRVILAAAIPLFRETSLDEGEILMPDIDANAFQSLVDYAYSCELKITMENVKSLLSGASVMGMKEVQEACCDFLIARLSPQNVLNFRELALALNLHQLKEFADHFVKENFEEVSKTKEFLCCPFKYVKELVSKDDLNVDREEKVLDCVLRWVKASVTERKKKLPELLREVRMVLLEPVYLTDLIEREAFIRTSLVSRDLVDEARNYNLFPKRRKKKCTFPCNRRQFMKISEGTQDAGKKLCTFQAEIKHTVSEFDQMKKTFCTKSFRSYVLRSGGTASLNKKIYFFYCSYLYEYNSESREHKVLWQFALERDFTAVVSSRNKVFVCGGLAIIGRTASNAVKCFDPGKKEWTQVNSLQTARWGLNAVSVEDFIFALGGRDFHKVYDVVERYNAVLGKWQFMTCMLTPRCFLGAAVLNGKIYACGGYQRINGSQCMATAEVYGPMATAEVYDPMTNKWTFISSMNTVRYKLSLVAFSGNLYAIDGSDADGKCILSSEVYDSDSDSWKCGPSISSSPSAAIAIEVSQEES